MQLEPYELSLDDEEASCLQEAAGDAAGGVAGEVTVERPVEPVPQRIAKLLDEMPGQRRVLLGIVEFCEQPRTAEQVDARVEELKRGAFSVYEPVTLRELLEQAGALAYDGEDREGGQGAQELHTEQVSISDEEQSVEFLEVEPAKAGLWRATPEGLQAAAENADAVRIAQLLEEQPQYVSVYLDMIRVASDGCAHSAKDMDARFNDAPELQQPRRYAGFFTAHLERSGAIEWNGGWVATPAGRAVLAREGEGHE